MTNTDWLGGETFRELPSVDCPERQRPGHIQTIQSATASNAFHDSEPDHSQACAKCELPIVQGDLLSAFGAVYHLDCFRCQDCNKIDSKAQTLVPSS